MFIEWIQLLAWIPLGVVFVVCVLGVGLIVGSAWMGSPHEIMPTIKAAVSPWLRRYYLAPRMYTAAVFFFALITWQTFFRFHTTYFGPPDGRKVRVYDRLLQMSRVYDSNICGPVDDP